MIERLVGIPETTILPIYPCLKRSMTWCDTWQSSLSIQHPWMEHVQIVFTAAHLAQVLNAVVVLVAIYVVNLLLWPAAFADRPDGMVQTDKNLSLAHQA